MMVSSFGAILFSTSSFSRRSIIGFKIWVRSRQVITTSSQDTTALHASFPTYRFQLLNLLLCLQLAKLLQEGKVGGKGLRLKKVQETEELIYTVLEGSAGEQHTMLLWWGGGGERRVGGITSYSNVHIVYTQLLSTSIVSKMETLMRCDYLSTVYKG